MNCIFCKIINKEIINDNIFYEDDNIIAILDIDYVVKWHALVIPKKHFENLSDMNEEEYLYFSKMVYKIEKELLKLCNKDRWVILKTWWIVSHFHFHIYPVNKDTSWSDLKDMIEKDPNERKKDFLYKYIENEKEDLIKDLSKNLSI
ncbi:MAG: hypothetical protein ACD_49C00029G0037 [uncultured bacterium (gcode 4)]|uniref:HIT domain-containing protein n=1 Tax=uncultured bacterium (gcode 4) TaxID=1234023 RepID=K2BWJ6_9BACT|nr:MAG: hypothetical protein ACD_49C00029G0037 [uncultured bacterium (gcode 4)]